MDAPFFHAILIALSVGAASGAVGSFIVIRRMALVGDALSHVALPGIALALAWEIDPFWGVIVFLAVAAGIVWYLEGRTRLPADALIGLLFTTSLAVGVMTIPDLELIESLFGEFPMMHLPLLLLIVGLAIILAVLIFVYARQFLFSVVSPDLARVAGISRYTDLGLLVIFGFVVALGIKLVGTLLMGALTIIPASIAKNLTTSLRSYVVTSTVLGACISVLGVAAAHSVGALPGPTIILIGIGLFTLTLFMRRA